MNTRILLFSAILVASCTESIEDKVRAPIMEFLEKRVNDTDGLQIVEIKSIDTIYQKEHLTSEIEAYNQNILTLKETESNFKRALELSKVRATLGQQVDTIKYVRKLTETYLLSDEANRRIDSLESVLSNTEENEIRGLNVTASVRAKNKLGNKVLSEYLFLVNPSLTNVIEIYETE